MDFDRLKAEYGRDIVFHGGMSIQQTLPYGNTEEIHREVRDRIERLAGNGGYILCTAHNIQADTPLENVEALFKAYSELGSYDNAR